MPVSCGVSLRNAGVSRRELTTGDRSVTVRWTIPREVSARRESGGEGAFRRGVLIRSGWARAVSPQGRSCFTRE
ncbi:hypothetical protein GCM10020366_29950 [Saccharopolyspora gregorii]|uniref:Uncharacterized protein n=1 Tax=Saccharopolyspora gregorii TaxID=33914 RepID=A0ABP6RP62_9PSEU